MFSVVQFTFATYGDYEYPWWAQMLGIFISLASMLWIPGYTIYYTLTTQGNLREVNANHQFHTTRQLIDIWLTGRHERYYSRTQTPHWCTAASQNQKATNQEFTERLLISQKTVCICK